MAIAILTVMDTMVTMADTNTTVTVPIMAMGTITVLDITGDQTGSGAF